MSEESNNFRELFREEEMRFEARQQEDDPVKAGLWRTLGFFKLIGQIIEVFIPKVLDVFVAAAGGNPESISKNYSKPPSEGPLEDDPRGLKPQRPENGDEIGRGPQD